MLTKLARLSFKRLLCALLAFIAFSPQLSARTPEQQYIDKLNRFQGNKLLLIGSWSARERAAWKKLFDEEGVFEFDIKITDTSDEDSIVMPRFGASDFEAWLRAKHAIGDSRWIIMNASNQVMARGNSIVNAEELISSMESSGLLSPVKQLRNFLKLYPDHLEARVDLFRQLRRRAVRLNNEKMVEIGAGGKESPQGSKIFHGRETKNQLDAKTDLIIWASLAHEVDVAFKGNWHGLEIPFTFFRAEEDQPEKNSPLMRAVFARHIAKVEAALLGVPTSKSLWNVWGWMARSLGDRDWKKLLKSLNTFSYPGGLTCPAQNVAVWLAGEAKNVGDWEQVVELAKMGVNFSGYLGESEMTWFPGGIMGGTKHEDIEGYPINSAFIPILEGLLRLGRLEEANAAFDDVLFFGGEGKREAMVKLAQGTGHLNLAQLWRTRMQDSSIRRSEYLTSLGSPSILEYPSTNPLPLKFAKIPIGQARTSTRYAFGWLESEKCWAVLDKDNRLVAEGRGELQEEPIFEALEKLGFRTKGELARNFLSEHFSSAYAHYVLASELVTDAQIKMQDYNLDAAQELDDDRDHELWGECAKNWLAYYENELALKTQIEHSVWWNLAESSVRVVTNSNLMKAAAKRIIQNLEDALISRPTSDYLWQAWLAWRTVDGNTRSIASLVEGLTPSPLTLSTSFPPPMVMNEYYNECILQEHWSEAIKLLRQSWERDMARLDFEIKRGKEVEIWPHTWVTGQQLIIALLHDGKISEAEDIVEEWFSRGGVFSDDVGIISLATKLGHEGSALKWVKP